MAQSNSNPASPVTGIALIIGAMACFALMDGVSKFLVRDYAIAQLFFVRYLVYIVFALWVCRKLGWRKALVSGRPVLQLARAAIVLVEGIAFVAAFRYLGLAEVHTIVAATPLLVTVLAATILAERIGLHRWLAVAIGFAGALLVIRPGVGQMSWPMLIPVVAACLYATIQIQARILSRYDTGEVTILYTAIVGLVFMTIIGPFFWVWPASDVLVRDLTLMALIGLLGAMAHYLLISAFRHAPASVLQPYTYFLVAWATLVGLVFFGDVPNIWTISGATVIIASGLYTFQRERRALK